MALNLKPFALAAIALAVTTSAQAVESKRGNETLKKWCTNDYLVYCGNISPDDPAMDACFKTNWTKLNENCRRAIDAYAPPNSKSGKRG
ncbi:3',5'-cyclic-nucleotide phosphodiesterase [Methylobacterium haplocladii]|uniref:3',5'-cyclic-nucleotide phosphodiesterase n=1 Tax=Methylobacterium haplocladii TaxID=1176176 RepID=A0A512IPC3_9HYPH|nr:3',5'-cyclic-nucleotide phosphodiesterase [Methylobacterium haplocladii]GEO99556.1 hypothetical protein MHA02_19440 [Methylobacterium haplocladii]GJD83698.1 hypothetical protein HPGCJGGD_1568 [Methylobacterium haplocladii]GLS60888.1 hypothetical protein GCM10007887_35770 [Methylobacterium haplocladii]